MAQYTQHIDFIYTTLLMIWGGSLIGVTMLAMPYIFKHIKSRDEASSLTTAILHREDILIRFVVLGMLIVFLFKEQLNYNYQHYEWFVYVCTLHFFIFGKLCSKRLHKLKEKITTFDTPAEDKSDRYKFNKLHKLVRYLYTGQLIGVILLLFFHAFGL